MKPTILVAAMCLCLGAFVGCHDHDSKESLMTSPGAVGECAPGCTAKEGKSCCPASGQKTSMGAVGDAKASGCCKSAATACPASSGTKTDTNMGAVSDTKASGCCKSAAPKKGC